MINYDALNRQQKIHFEMAVDALQSFRENADDVMYYCDDYLNDEDQKKMREAYDLVCKAIDLIN